MRRSPGFPASHPSPQFASSCTLTRTDVLEPTEKLPANEKPFARLNWPCPTCIQVTPLSTELKTRTSVFVRLAVEGPAQAVATYDAVPSQANDTVTSELCADASGTNHTENAKLRTPMKASKYRRPKDRRKACRP